MNINIHIDKLFAFGLILLSSCEREISIDLNKSNPRFVIEGNVSNIKGESKVIITKTLNFDETIDYPLVSGAIVTITDTTINQTDLLTENNEGIYVNTNLTGIIGHTYKMTVKIDNETFTSLSTMPSNFALDTLVQQNLAGTSGKGGPPAGTPGAGTRIQILPQYKNLTKSDKYFQFVIIKNDSLMKGINARSDLGLSGFSFPFPISIHAKKNDTLIVDMQFIDKTVFDYLYGLNRNVGQFSATPSNPTSNISNGALGYFKAHTSQKKMLIVK